MAKTFLFLLLVFILTSFITEWRLAARTQEIRIQNEQNYQAIVTNVVLLNRCYVTEPDENYCFAVLKIIGSQLAEANYKTDNLQTIWLNCYMYLASISLAPFPKLHDRIVAISINESLVGGTLADYTPSDNRKVGVFQQELRATYRERIQLELNKRNKQTPIPTQP